MKSQNPFDTINADLAEIKQLLKEKELGAPAELLKYIPVTQLIAKKVCSRSTLYAHYKSGHFNLYKFGGKTFVEKEEFEKAFRKVQIRIEKAA